jgi:hypothetical protein
MFKLLATGLFASFFSLFITAPAFADDNGIAYAIHTVRAESGKACMVGHFHHGRSSSPVANRGLALKTAINQWVEFTVLEYGSDWGHFKRGANRSVDCEKVSSNKWACKVKARPCRKGLSVAAR